MKFITEIDLRTAYRQAPFTTFSLSSETRLTPEARQFLLDRKITITTAAKRADQQKNQKLKRSAETSAPATAIKKSPEELLLQQAFEKCSGTFLLAVSLVLKQDTNLADKLLAMNQHLQQLLQAYQQDRPLPSFSKHYLPQAGMVLPPLELSVIHLQAEYGQLLAVLNWLKQHLQELLLFLELHQATIGSKKTVVKLHKEIRLLQIVLNAALNKLMTS